jgi:hypothetical protein
VAPVQRAAAELGAQALERAVEALDERIAVEHRLPAGELPLLLARAGLLGRLHDPERVELRRVVHLGQRERPVGGAREVAPVLDEDVGESLALVLRERRLEEAAVLRELLDEQLAM